MRLSMSSDRETVSEVTAYHLLERAAADHGERTAITFIEDADERSSKSITHQQFISRIHQFSHLLIELGVQRTDVVSILCPTVTDSVVALFSAGCHGGR